MISISLSSKFLSVKSSTLAIIKTSVSSTTSNIGLHTISRFLSIHPGVLNCVQVRTRAILCLQKINRSCPWI